MTPEPPAPGQIRTGIRRAFRLAVRRRDVRRDDVDEEIRFHVDMRVRQLVARGLSEPAARAQAAEWFAGAGHTMDEARDELHRSAARQEVRMIATQRFHGLLRDARLALRSLRRAPGLTAAAVLTLALGIGANAAISSIVYAVLLRPLPYADAERIVALSETQRGERTGVGPGQFIEWGRRARAFEALAAQTSGTFNVSGGTAAERVVGAFVTPSLFRTLAMAPTAGRYLADDEAAPGRDHVVVLSDRLFRTRFGGDRRVVGRVITLNGEPYTVVGVAPAAFSLHAAGEELWVPFVFRADHATRFDEAWLTVYGKLRPGVSLDAAQRDLERVTREIAALAPEAMIDRGVRIVDFRADLTGDYQRQLTVLAGAVAFILLLACLNVTGLLLARLSTRRTEIAVNVALGAGPGRVVRQLLVESTVLALIGGAAALLVAVVLIRLLVGVAPADIPRIDGATSGIAGVGLVVLLAALVPTLVIGILIGVLPAVRATRGDVQSALREGGRGAGGAPRDRLRAALVVGEIGLALVLLGGAALFVRSARNLARVDLGFDASHLTTARVTLAGAPYASPAQIVRAAERMAAQLRALPNVRDATASTALPLANDLASAGLHVDGRIDPPGQTPDAAIRTVGAGYFAMMAIPIVEGRAFADADREGAPAVAIVNDVLARRLAPGRSPIGMRFHCCSADTARIWREVVGVSRGVRHRLTEPPRAEVYVPFAQAPVATWGWFGNSVTLAVRTGPGRAIPDVRAAVAAVDPSLPVYDVRTYDDLRRRATAENRFALLLFSGFALLAVTLAAVGIYGVLAYLVGQRTREIAVRMALGAEARDIRTMILREGSRLAAGGIALGVALTLVAGRALESLLYDVAPRDPATLAIAVVVLGAVALGACWVPARRAAGVEPYDVLRQ